jgi:hypothetical protein
MGGKAAVKERKRSDDLTVTGAAMGAVGGAFLIGSIPLAWVILNGSGRTVFDLMEDKFLFITILIAQLLGLAGLVISLRLLRSAGWQPERKKVWAVPLLAIGLIITICMTVGIVLIQMDYMQNGSLFSFGAAPFLGIFGTVFSVSGALMFLLDIKAKQPGPVQSRRTPEDKSFKEVRHAPPARFDRSCPGCGADVSDDLAVCPECGAVLGAEKEEEDIGEIDDLTDDDIETVR